mgnify:CR=1 FL=1
MLGGINNALFIQGFGGFFAIAVLILILKWAFPNKKDLVAEKERKELDRGWSEAFAESYNNEIDMFKDNDAINPPHYKNVAAGKQYMELMVDMLENKSGVEAHLFGQVYKYLMRCGNKDQEVQELNKALWYLQALIKYKSEGKVL